MSGVRLLKSPLFPTALEEDGAKAVARVMERGCGEP